MMRDLRCHNDLPWVVGGDVNEIFFNREKKGGVVKPQGVLDMFRECFEEAGLYDLDYEGYDYTWENKREDGAIIEERLDRFCASIEWSCMFPDAYVTHINEDLSDHLPIVLSLHFQNTYKRKGRKKSFRFENMWLQNDDCRSIVEQAWGGVRGVDPWNNLSFKKRVQGAPRRKAVAYALQRLKARRCPRGARLCAP